MDINKKLSYYRSRPAEKSHTKSSALQALKEIFSAQICEPKAPYLKIERFYSMDAPKSLHLRKISKQTLPESLALEKCLFFDLETTGLAGGAGTFPFLLGFGYFSGQKFIVESYFLPDYGREFYLYQKLKELFARFDCLVSFNGKSYDLPLLKNRFILNRIEVNWDRFRHIDLLHMSRRIWKDSYPALDLQSIERNLLSRHREEDIPGFLIPESYFTFLKTGVIHDMRRVIEHNYLDIISLADLVLLLNQIEAKPSPIEDERVLIRLAHLHFESANDRELDAIATLFKKRGPSIPEDILFWQSIRAKRNADWTSSMKIWEELAGSKKYYFICLEEMAKYLEHQKKDFPAALNICQRALKNIRVLQELNPYTVSESLIESFSKRAARLQSKSA